MKRRFEVRLGNAVAAGLSLAILLVTVAMGWTVYADLYEVILDGFDRKLTAISTTTGSFISGDEHRALERADRLQGLAYDPGRERLYRLDPASGALLEIDPASDEPRTVALHRLDPARDERVEIDPASPESAILARVHGLAYAPSRDLLAALEAAGGESWLVSLDRVTGRVARIGNVGFEDCFGLAFDEPTDSFYCVSPGEARLVRIDPELGTGEAGAGLDGEYLFLASGPAGALISVTSVEDESAGGVTAELQEISLADGQVTRSKTLRRLDWMNGVFGLAWAPARDSGWLVTDRFLEIGWVGDSAASVYATTDGALYQRYGEAMRGTLSKAGITYLYTQIAHDDPSRCVYILNADCDPGHVDHTPLGAEDTLPEESVRGQRDVLSRAGVFLSSVRAWEQWGLLKNAFAPIFDESGEVSAIAGADVNISIIREKTRDALLKVFGIGVLFFMAGLLVAVLVARKIVGPIAQVKEAALRFGAGQYAERIEGGRLKELDQLSSAFNDLGETLEGTVDRMEKANHELETLRRLREMEEHLARRLADTGAETGARLAWTVPNGSAAASSSGILGGPAGALAWLAPGAQPRAEAIARRFEISTVLRRELAALDPEQPWARLERLYPRSVAAYLWLPRGGAEVYWLARAETEVFLLAGGRARAERWRDTGRARLPRDGGLIVGVEGAEAEALVGKIATELEQEGGDARTLLERLQAVGGARRRGVTLVALGGEGREGREGG